MLSVLEAPDEQHEPNSRSRTVLCGPKVFTEGNRAYAWSCTLNIVTSETLQHLCSRHIAQLSKICESRP
jgi:hypothetical protein